MQYIASVTQKGQVTIPKEIRDEIKIKIRGKVRIEKAKDHVKVYPDDVPNILDLAGKFKVPKGTNVLRAREDMEKNYARF
jgi:AbrB family looped-hinge helix DNA binding protein